MNRHGAALPARRLASLSLLVAIAACRLEERPPNGSRQDLPAVEKAVAGFYQALAARDSGALGQVAFAGGAALLGEAGGNGEVVPLATLLASSERRLTGRPPRLARSEIHLDGSVATARVLLVAPSGEGSAEVEATDNLILGLRAGMWRVALGQLGPWRTRQAQ